MARKQSIYISTAAEQIIGTITEDTNLSGRINSIIVRYGGILERDCPAMAVNEWMAIVDILNSTWRDTESARADIARSLWAEIADSAPDGIGEKWSIDCEVLAQQVRGMSYAQQCAIIEVANRFWQGHDSQEWQSDRQRLEAMGARIS